MTPPASPADDVRLAEAAARTASHLFATTGGAPLFAMIDSPSAGLVTTPAEGTGDEEDKMHFMNVVRFLSIEHGGRRAAIAFESWTILGQTAEDMRLAEEIKARGGSLREHPNVGEALVVIVESDEGRTMRINRIVRDGVRITVEPDRDDFTPAGQDASMGTFRDFHVPTDLQGRAEMRLFADMIREQISMTSEPIGPGEGTTIN